MREAAALCLQSFNERAQERSNPKVTARGKVVLDSRLITPLGARVILLMAQERSASTEKVLMADGVQMKEQFRLHHWSGRNDLVHLLGRWHGR